MGRRRREAALKITRRGVEIQVGRTGAWVLVAACTLAIFLFVPTARAIQFFVSKRWGRAMFGTGVVFAVVTALVLVFTYLIFDRKTHKVSNYVWTAAAAGLYLYFTYQLRANPEESVHFVEYGLLGTALFIALSFSTRDWTIYPAACLIGCLVGFFDEFLQWLTPLRYIDIRDVGVNVLASALIQVGIWKGIAPILIGERVRARTLRRVCVLAAANLVCLGLFISATPRRVEKLIRAVPALSFLREQETVFEFKYRYKDPEVGTFHSRMTKREMTRTDRAKAAEYAPILKAWEHRDYLEFLDAYPRLLFPFLQEFKAHVLLRDKMLDRGRTDASPEEKARAIAAAWRENRLLEKYFPETLRTTGYRWDEATRRAVESKAEGISFAYVSTVAFTPHDYLNENLAWVLLGLGFIGIAALWVLAPQIF
jgi:VanZ family protein